MVQSIPHNLPIKDGRFSFYASSDRIESGIDFVMSSYSIVREYNENFSTRFLWEFIQAPNSLIISTQSAYLIRLTALLTASIPFLQIQGTSFSPFFNGDRKVHQFSVDYRNSEPGEVNDSPNLFVRFL